jgi:hypothetical protein
VLYLIRWVEGFAMDLIEWKIVIFAGFTAGALIWLACKVQELRDRIDKLEKRDG